MDSIAPPPATTLRHPASSKRILISFLIAFLLLLLPWHGVGIWLHPDFLALLLIYWGLYEPTIIGAGSAFLLGFLMDLAESHVLGVHGLTYSLLFYLVQLYRIRILSFYRLNQTLHVLLLLGLAQWSEGLVNGILGFPWPSGPWWCVPPIIGAISWLFLPFLIDRTARSIQREHR